MYDGIGDYCRSTRNSRRSLLSTEPGGHPSPAICTLLRVFVSRLPVSDRAGSVTARIGLLIGSIALLGSISERCREAGDPRRSDRAQVRFRSSPFVIDAVTLQALRFAVRDDAAAAGRRLSP